MYKNNDEAIDWEAKRLLDDGIYTDTEQAYLEAEKIVINIREQAKQRQIKQQFKIKIKSIKKKLDKVMIMLMSRIPTRENIEEKINDNKNNQTTNCFGTGTSILLGS